MKKILTVLVLALFLVTLSQCSGPKHIKGTSWWVSNKPIGK